MRRMTQALTLSTLTTLVACSGVDPWLASVPHEGTTSAGQTIGSKPSAAANPALVVWGYNNKGQLGDGTTINRQSPVVLANVPKPKQLAAGADHSLLLTEDGHVWAWGWNNWGQLGDGTNIDRLTPSPVPGLEKIVYIAAGTDNSGAVAADGTVWVWGNDSYGQLGPDVTADNAVDHNTPHRLSQLGDVRKLVIADQTLFALQHDGTLWGWGSGYAEQLGAATAPQGSTSQPQRIAEELAPIDDVGSSYTTLVISHRDGLVYAFGYNGFGQWANGSAQGIYSTTPQPVTGLPGRATAIAAGLVHDFVLVDTGCGQSQVWGWGYNQEGQLGDDSSTNRYRPVQALGVDGASSIGAGSYTGLALVSGRVLQWGRGEFGELGQPTPCCSSTPRAVPGLSDVTEVAVGAEHTLAFGVYAAPASCHDGVKNGDESDVDCGGNSGCARCTDTKACVTDSDCEPSNFCEAFGKGLACGPG